MKSSPHPIEQEELMAYFDGQLPRDRATVVAAHLEQCEDCRAATADFHAVSKKLAKWQVEPAPARLAERVNTLLDKAASEAKKGVLGTLTPPRPLVPRWVWGLAGAVVVFLFIAAISIPNLLRSRISSERAVVSPYLLESAGAGASSQIRDQDVKSVMVPPTGPMIIRTASLTLVAKDFDQARTAIETIVLRHQGHCAQLTVRGRADTGRTLTATFRVPAEQLDPVLAELRTVGPVEEESQGGEEVTQQYVDLRARLSNARNTEQRLIEILRQRTGKVPDILAVEQEIARVREGIERMDAQLKNLENQVRLASLQVRLREEYKLPLALAQTSTVTRLRNAVVEGYHSLVESVVGLVEFLLSYGPVLLFWGLILYFPVRFAWRRLRAPRTGS